MGSVRGKESALTAKRRREYTCQKSAVRSQESGVEMKDCALSDAYGAHTNHDLPGF